MSDRPVRLTGWGRSTTSTATVVQATDARALGRLVADVSPQHGVVPRGLGRSYGDAAHNDGGLVLARVNPHTPPLVDPERGTVTAAAGVSMRALIAATLPHGFLPPVLPGTAHVTVGGAVAADVHGKNHHADGSFGSWIESLDLVDGEGALRRLTPESAPQPFWATVGGMGLTGVVVEARLRLLPVRSDRLRVTTSRYDDIDDVLAAMAASTARYHVAWVDGTARGGRLGRAVLDEADHAESDDRMRGQGPRTASYHPRQVLAAPPTPVSPLRPGLVRAFNAARWRRSPRRREHLAGLSAFFHPLDAVAGWNRLYGRAGFLQYQFVVPSHAAALVRKSLELLATGGAPPYLVVLKRFGQGDPGPLSFPAEGWTLAADVPADRPGLAALLDRLDDLVAGAGGRVYLAKDARLRADTLRAMYPRVDEWLATRDRLDPKGRFRSDLGRRLGLVGRSDA